MQKIGLMDVTVKQSGKEIDIPALGTRSKILGALNSNYSDSIVYPFNEIIGFFSRRSAAEIVAEQFSVEMFPGSEMTKYAPNSTASFSFYLSIFDGVPYLFYEGQDEPFIPLGRSFQSSLFSTSDAIERAAVSASLTRFFEAAPIREVIVAMSNLDPPNVPTDPEHTKSVVQGWKKWQMQYNRLSPWDFMTLSGDDLLTTHDYSNQFVERNSNPLSWNRTG